LEIAKAPTSHAHICFNAFEFFFPGLIPFETNHLLMIMTKPIACSLLRLLVYWFLVTDQLLTAYCLLTHCPPRSGQLAGSGSDSL